MDDGILYELLRLRRDDDEQKALELLTLVLKHPGPLPPSLCLSCSNDLVGIFPAIVSVAGHASPRMKKLTHLILTKVKRSSPTLTRIQLARVNPDMSMLFIQSFLCDAHSADPKRR